MSLLTDIKSYDTILTINEMKEIDRIASRNRWMFGAASDTTTPFKRFWKMEIKGMPIFDTVIPEKMKILIPFEFEITDYYLNGHTYGLSGGAHKDDADYTFVLFCNPTWDITWGGKTMFVQDDGRFDSVFPKPGSAVLFPSDILHWAEETSREFYGLRVTAAYKLKKVETQDEHTDA